MSFSFDRRDCIAKIFFIKQTTNQMKPNIFIQSKDLSRRLPNTEVQNVLKMPGTILDYMGLRKKNPITIHRIQIKSGVK